MIATANVLVGLADIAAGPGVAPPLVRVAQRERYEPGRLVATAVIWCSARPTDPAPAPVLRLLRRPELRWSGSSARWLAALAAGQDLLRPPGRPDPTRTPPRGDHGRPPRGRDRLASSRSARRWRLVPLLALPIAEVSLLAAHPLEEHLNRKYEVSPPRGSSRSAPRCWSPSPGRTARRRPRSYVRAPGSATGASVVASPASFNNRARPRPRGQRAPRSPAPRSSSPRWAPTAAGEIRRAVRLGPARDRRASPPSARCTSSACGSIDRDRARPRPRSSSTAGVGRAQRRRPAAGRPWPTTSPQQRHPGPAVRHRRRADRRRRARPPRPTARTARLLVDGTEHTVRLRRRRPRDQRRRRGRRRSRARRRRRPRRWPGSTACRAPRTGGGPPRRSAA